jgi:hypothetical protein
MRSDNVGSGSHFVCLRLNWPGGSLKAVASIVTDQEVFDRQLDTDRSPFPSEGDITLPGRKFAAFQGGQGTRPALQEEGMKNGSSTTRA